MLTVYSPEEMEDMNLIDDDCEAVELDWDVMSMSDYSDYVWLYERPLDCALASDSTPFEPGGPGGLPSRPAEWFGSVEVQVGDTAVAIDSTFGGDELDALAATLVPVDT
jgi:hypothetical protein